MPKPNETDFLPPPEGTHAARCYRVVDLGTQQVDWQGQIKHQHKVIVSWELFCAETMEDGRNFSVHQRYTFSSSDKSTFRKHLESWRGKRFEEHDFGPGGFNIKNIIDVPCLLSIAHNPKGDRIYANVTAVVKPPTGMEIPELTNEKIFLSLESDVFDQAVFDSLSDGIKDTIRKSPEFAKLNAYQPQGDHDHESGEQEDEIPF